MASPLTDIQPGSIDADEESRVLEMDDEEAHAVLDTFASETTRTVYAALCVEPATPSELAEELDVSLQNLSYHLDKLEAADLVQPSGTRYSSRGHEMTVYAARADPLVFTGDADSKTTLRAELPRVLGGVAVVSGVGLLGQWALQRAGVLVGGDNVGTASVETSAESLSPLVSLLFEPAVLLLVGACLMAAVVLALEVR